MHDAYGGVGAHTAHAIEDGQALGREWAASVSAPTIVAAAAGLASAAVLEHAGVGAKR